MTGRSQSCSSGVGRFWDEKLCNCSRVYIEYTSFESYYCERHLFSYKGRAGNSKNFKSRWIAQDTSSLLSEFTTSLPFPKPLEYGRTIKPSYICTSNMEFIFQLQCKICFGVYPTFNVCNLMDNPISNFWHISGNWNSIKIVSNQKEHFSYSPSNVEVEYISCWNSNRQWRICFLVWWKTGSLSSDYFDMFVWGTTASHF